MIKTDPSDVCRGMNSGAQTQAPILLDFCFFFFFFNFSSISACRKTPNSSCFTTAQQLGNSFVSVNRAQGKPCHIHGKHKSLTH